MCTFQTHRFAFAKATLGVALLASAVLTARAGDDSDYPHELLAASQSPAGAFASFQAGAAGFGATVGDDPTYPQSAMAAAQAAAPGARVAHNAGPATGPADADESTGE